MKLKIIENEFSICKIENISLVNYSDEFYFIGKTDEEISLVCSTQNTPKDCLECNHGWRAFRIEGVLDFSLVGILSKIAQLLAENHISIFAVSTFNTDYILIKKDKFAEAVNLLKKSDYRFV